MANRPRHVGLYGSQSGDWRQNCIDFLRDAGLTWLDPTSSRWRGITSENGDEMQETIDELVAEQHRGLLGSACVIYHLGSEASAMAARCELGFLTGRSIQTFAHIEADVQGRNYLWAQMKPYSHMVRCHSVREACEKAAEYLRKRS